MNPDPESHDPVERSPGSQVSVVGLGASAGGINALRDLGDRRGEPAATTITGRERQVLRLMAMGHSNRESAGAMGISVKTVEVHKANSMRKLDLKGRTDVVRYAVLNGWLQDV